MKLSRSSIQTVLCLCVITSVLTSCSGNKDSELPGPEEPVISRAIRIYDEALFSTSVKEWEKLKDEYPGSYFSSLYELKLADSWFYAGDYVPAIAAYEEFVRLHPAHEASEYAQLQIANAHLAQYRGALKDQSPARRALEQFKLFLTKYPKSRFENVARERSKLCNALLAQHDQEVSAFYQKQGLVGAASARAEDADSLRHSNETSAPLVISISRKGQ